MVTFGDKMWCINGRRGPGVGHETDLVIAKINWTGARVRERERETERPQGREVKEGHRRSGVKV